MLCRYDVELFQKIEALTGQKMEKFEAEQDAALVLLDGVNEAQRIATMQVNGATLNVTVVIRLAHYRSFLKTPPFFLERGINLTESKKCTLWCRCGR